MNIRRTILPTFLFTLIILSVFSHLLLRVDTRAQLTYPEIYVAGPILYASPGDVINASIMISNIQNLFAYQIYMDISPDVVEVTNIIEGDFLKRGAYAAFWRAIYNASLVRVWESLLRGSPESSGNGELFRVTLRVKKAGSSPMHLRDIAMTNQFNTELKPFTVVDGTVTTARLEFTPNVLKGAGYLPGNTFNVTVALNGTVENLYGYDLNITYGTQVINATSVALLPAFGSPNTNFTEIDTAAGRIHLYLNCTPPAPPTSTVNPLAILTFDVLAINTTEIRFSESIVFDSNGSTLATLNGKSFFSGGLIRNIGITEATINPSQVVQGNNITLSVSVVNDGPLNETSTILAYAFDGIWALVGGPAQFFVDPNQTKALTLGLSSEGLSGNFTLRIFLAYLPDETSTGDNFFEIPGLQVTPRAEEAPSPFGTTFFVAAGIVIVVVAAVLYYVVRKRKS